jgi:hypothetical protein
MTIQPKPEVDIFVVKKAAIIHAPYRLPGI